MLNELFLLTLKPRMYVLNVSEDVLGAANNLLERIASGEDVDIATLEGELIGIAKIAQRAKSEGSEIVAVSARLEAELVELPEEDAAEYLESLGLPKLGTDRVIQVGYPPAQFDYISDSGRGRSARLDCYQGRKSARSRRQDPYRHRARFHSR